MLCLYDIAIAILLVKKLLKYDKEVKFDIIWEDDNGLELDDPGYEEYYLTLFNDIKIGKDVLICYHDIPKEI